MKNHKVDIIILSILLIVSITFNVYLALAKANQVPSSRVEVQQNNVANNSNTDGNQVQIVEKVVEKGIFVPFSSEKVKNANNGDKYYLEPKSCLDLEILFSDNKVTITLADEVNFNRQFPDSKLKRGEQYTVQNVKGTIAGIYTGTIGNGISYPTLLLLMSDGTVQVVDMKTGVNTGNFQSKGAIKELNNIVGFENVKSGKEAMMRTIVAIDKEGNAYDIFNTSAKSYL